MGWVGSAGHLQLIIDHGRAGPLGTRLLFPTYLRTYLPTLHYPPLRLSYTVQKCLIVITLLKCGD